VLEEVWLILYVDGSSIVKGGGVTKMLKILLEGPNNMLIEKSLHLNFKSSNNQVEYEVLIFGLALAKDMGVTKIICLTNSRLIVGHLIESIR